MTTKKKTETFPASDAKFHAAFTELMANLAASDPTSSTPAIDTFTRLGINVASVYTPLLNLLGSATTPNSWLYAQFYIYKFCP